MWGALTSLLNPWEMTFLQYMVGYVAMRLSFVALDLIWKLIVNLASTPLLPTRTGEKKVYSNKLDWTDELYLNICSVIEYTFTQNVVYLCWYSPLMTRDLTAFGLLNGPAAIWWLLVVDDFFYAPYHRFLHWKPIYPYIHKHHHRSVFPARGYNDAANDHPLEQLGALSFNWLAIHVVAWTSGLHCLALLCHFSIKGVLACFNHTGYDFRFRCLGLEYSVRAHEMHHRRNNKNYAQYVMFWDRLMGTYEEYQGLPGIEAKPRDASATGSPAVAPVTEFAVG
jgi:sterol desaturase/sphingolipid hydroxylase (fatty acid hydroxylase superfamily)